MSNNENINTVNNLSNENTLFYEHFITELNVILNNKKIMSFINKDKESNELLAHLINLLNLSNIDYFNIDTITALYKNVNSGEWSYDINYNFDNSELLIKQIRLMAKKLRVNIYNNIMVDVNKLVYAELEKETSSKTVALIEEEEQENDVLICNNNENTDENTDNNLSEYVLNLRKKNIIERFKVLKSKKWYKKIFNEHIKLYIVIRNKKYVKSREQVLLRNFINCYNEELQLNLNEYNISKDFNRAYQKYMIKNSYAWAVRIWVFIVGIPLMIACIVLVFVVIGIKNTSGTSGSSSTTS